MYVDETLSGGPSSSPEEDPVLSAWWEDEPREDADWIRAVGWVAIILGCMAFWIFLARVLEMAL